METGTYNPFTASPNANDSTDELLCVLYRSVAL
jgi:hypothetical protein